MEYGIATGGGRTGYPTPATTSLRTKRGGDADWQENQRETKLYGRQKCRGFARKEEERENGKGAQTLNLFAHWSGITVGK